MPLYFLIFALSVVPGGAIFAWHLAGYYTGVYEYYRFSSLYAMFFVGMFFIFCAGMPIHPALGMIPFLLALFGWFAGMLHIANRRPEIEIRLRNRSASSDSDAKSRGVVPPPLPNEYRSNDPAVAGQKVNEIAEKIIGSGTKRPIDYELPSPYGGSIERLDVNTAGRSELAALPSVGTTLALTILQNRESNGRFHSFDDLCQRCGIKPHVRIAIEDRVVFGTSTPYRSEHLEDRETKYEKPSPRKPGARRID